MTNTKDFTFDGGAATFLGTQILVLLVIVFSFGLAYPFALVLLQRWKAKHTLIRGRRLEFTGTGMSLFGNWLKWMFLFIITLGIYGFWIGPRIAKWVVENTEIQGLPQDQPMQPANTSPQPQQPIYQQQ